MPQELLYDVASQHLKDKISAKKKTRILQIYELFFSYE